jgi:hypothetical protein
MNSECPFCKEDIKEGAIKCKHCGSDLRDNHIQQNNCYNKASVFYEALLLGIPLITTLLIWALASNRGYSTSGPRLMLLLVVTLFGTALVASLEASQIGMKSSKKWGFNPSGWFFRIALIWFYGYPAYLHERYNYGRTNYKGVGIFIVILFLGSFVVFIKEFIRWLT